MLELHLAADAGKDGLFGGLVRQFLLVEEVKDVVARRRGRLHLGHALGQGAQGGGEQPHIKDKGHNNAEGDLAAHGQGGAQHAHHHIAQIADTFQNYQMITKRHVLPWFEGKRLLLSEVNRKVLQEFLDEKALCGRLDGKGGLSPKSIRELKNILNQTLNEAVREELLHANPCTLLRLPPKEPSCAKFYTLDQLNALLNAIREEPLYPVIRTAVVYGLRRSELLGLKWDSIDFENEMLTIRHTVVKVYTTVAKDKTKTKSSYRSFPLLPEMRDLFLTLRDEQERNRRLLGRGYVKTDYVFCWPDGRPFTSDYVSHRFGKLLKKYGLPPIRLHDLRHSCASFLINRGFDLKAVQEWMGHADIGTTANIYGHLEIQRKQAMAAKMSDCIIG